MGQGDSHGTGVDDVTQLFTFKGADRLEEFVFVDARWTVWVRVSQEAVCRLDAASEGMNDIATDFGHEVIVDEGVVL